MKKYLLVIAVVIIAMLTVATTFTNQGPYLPLLGGSTTSDTEIDTRVEFNDLRDISSKGELPIDGATSVSITSSGGTVYFQAVSGAAGAANFGTGVKFVMGYVSTNGDGVYVTLTADAAFTNQYSYMVFGSYLDATDGGEANAVNISNVDGTHFEVDGVTGKTVKYIAIGY